MSTSYTESPPKSGMKVPSGHILIHEKWTCTELGSQLARQAKGIISGGLGFVDFYLSDSCPVVYVTEADFVCSPSYKNKLVKLKSICGGKGMVVVVRNGGTIENFNELQEFALLKLDLFVFPVGCQMELPMVLHKMAMNQARSPNNYKQKPKSSSSIASQQMALLTHVPGVGGEKANQLLQHFGNIATISQASEDALVRVVGAATAQHIHNFFNKSMVH